MEHEFINYTLLSTGKIHSIKRLLTTLPNDEAEILEEKIKRGEKTGYATIGCPWENFYSSITMIWLKLAVPWECQMSDIVRGGFRLYISY